MSRFSKPIRVKFLNEADDYFGKLDSKVQKNFLFPLMNFKPVLKANGLNH